MVGELRGHSELLRNDVLFQSNRCNAETERHTLWFPSRANPAGEDDCQSQSACHVDAVHIDRSVRIPSWQNREHATLIP